MNISLKLNFISERKAREIFRDEMIEYLKHNNQSNENHNRSQTKMLEQIFEKLDSKEHTTLTYEEMVNK